MVRASIFVRLFLLVLVGCSQKNLDGMFSCSTRCQGEKLSISVNGWHSGIVLPRELFPEFSYTDAPYLEFGWGDADFYPHRGFSISKGIKALFFSSGSVIQVVPTYSPESIVLYVDDLRPIRDAIVKEFKSFEPLGPSLYGQGHFYQGNRAFSPMFSCNTWVAKILSSCIEDSDLIRVSGLYSQIEKLKSCPKP